jgi:hypothetical protein
VPSLFHVSSLLDGGAGSGGFGDLRYCLTQANASPGPNAVVFDVRGTITLNSALPALTRDVAILGPGPGGLIVTMPRTTVFADKFLTVNAGVTAGVSGLTFANAQPTGLDRYGGGAIANAGTLTVSDCTLSANYVNLAYSGGAITNTGTLTVENSTLDDNVTFTLQGGAI